MCFLKLTATALKLLRKCHTAEEISMFLCMLGLKKDLVFLTRERKPLSTLQNAVSLKSAESFMFQKAESDAL